MGILLIDNYDSFTYNVYQYLMELKYRVICVRNDQIKIEDIEKMDIDAIFISPGPGRPIDAGICIDVVKKFYKKTPIFGICLGHQIIGEAFGGDIIHASELYHGKTSKICVEKNDGIFNGFGKELIATRYHSLIIDEKTLPDCLDVTCRTQEGEIMGVRHKEYEIEGVQFHPESVMTEDGMRMLENFLVRINAKKDFDLGEEQSDNIRYDKVSQNVEKLGIKQFAEIVKISTDYFKMFEVCREEFGSENCSIFDSVGGPKIDCGKSYIGLFPQLELEINNHKMKVITDNEYVSRIFKHNFEDIYDEESQSYDLKNKKFSDIYPTLAAMFHEEKQHSYDMNFTNGLMGIFSYEYLHYIEKIYNKNEKVLGFPDIHIRYFSCILQYEPKTQELFISKNDCAGFHNEQFKIEKIIEKAEKFEKKNDARETDNIEVVDMSIEKAEFCEKLKKVKEYIRNGDIFQVQIGRRLHLKTKLEPFELYKTLRKINPSPYMFYWDAGDYQLIGNSPELQLKVTNGEVIIRPIAGTSKGKGKNAEEAEKLRVELEQSPKEDAEHIMLVDLARNDIGRIAKAGSVKVTTLMKSEEFAHVFHLISSVEGKIEKGTNTMKLFESTFPAGTLTGAPKVRAMEIINEIENQDRGPYGGAIAFFDFDGNIISSIIIRTVLRCNEDIYLHASAGIVADSVDVEEWNEIEYKTETIKQALLQYMKVN